MLWCMLGAWAWSAPKADILIVVDSRVAGQKDLEQALRHYLKTARDQRGLSSEILPIDTYDLSKAGQQVAVTRLGIESRLIPFLGMSQLDGGGRPDKVLISVDKVQSAEDGISRLNTRFLALASQPEGESAVCGKWKQYIMYEGKLTWLLTARVSYIGGEYHYTLEAVSPLSNVQRIHITNTVVAGLWWSFDSDWGPEGLAHFKMHADTPDRYVGYSYLNGHQRDAQTWVRVEDGPDTP
jgi:hypothetical protein